MDNSVTRELPSTSSVKENYSCAILISAIHPEYTVLRINFRHLKRAGDCHKGSFKIPASYILKKAAEFTDTAQKTLINSLGAYQYIIIQYLNPLILKLKCPTKAQSLEPYLRIQPYSLTFANPEFLTMKNACTCADHNKTKMEKNRFAFTSIRPPLETIEGQTLAGEKQRPLL